MKTGTKILSTLAVVAVIGSGAVAYQAHAAKEEGGPGRMFLGERFAELSVTGEQKAEVKAILHMHQPTAEPLLKRFVAERRALRGLIHSGTVDENAIRVQAAKVAAVGADLAVESARVAHEIRSVLTPEQIDKLKEMRVDLDARIDRQLDRIAKRIAED